MPEVYGNDVTGTVTSGGTDAPSAGTSQTWTVNWTVAAPAVNLSSSATWFYIADVAAGSTEQEKIQVTSCAGGTGFQSVTVTRGADGTTPVAHGSGFTVQQVLTRASLQALQPAWYNVTAYGADPTGTADSSAAFNAAFAALPAAGGVIYAPKGTYKVTSGITMSLGANQTVVIRGDGPNATTLAYHGSGDCVRMTNSLAFGSGGATSWFSGVRDLTIDGTSGTGNPVGLHMGDITFLQVQDVVIQNFTGTSSVGLHLDNATNWTEEGDYRLAVSNCTKGVMLDVTTGYNSFGYSNFDVTFFQTGAQSCFCVENGALLYHSTLRIRGDVNGSASSLAGNPAVIRVTGTAPLGTPDAGSSPAIVSSRLDVLIEPNNQSGTATHLMSTLYLDGTSFGYIAGCYGMLDFASGTGSFTAVSTSVLPGNTGNLISFSGIVVGDSNLNPSGLTTWMTWGGGTVLNYMQSVTTFDGFFPTIQGDNFHTVLDGTNGTVFFNYGGVGNGDTLAAPQLKRFLIQQPPSGGPYTLTWPSNGSPTNASPTVIWPGGQPPVLQTAANATDIVEVITWDGATWYGRSVQPAGVPLAEQFTCLSSSYTLANSTSAQKLFNASSNGALTVAASTAYWVDGEFDITGLSSSSHTVEFGFGGTATFTSLKYTADTNTGAAGTLAAWQTVVVTSASATALMAAGTSTTFQARLRGILRVNAGGTLIPQVTQLTASAAAVVSANSWIRLTPVGSSTVTTAGNWS